jgi:hypothetical protein
MNDKFDELAKGLAQSVTRRGVLKKFCLRLVWRSGLAMRSIRATLFLGAVALVGAEIFASDFTVSPLIQVSKDPDPLRACDTGFRPVGDVSFDDEIETRIAVNPTNPSHLVATWMGHGLQANFVGVSFDGGTTWQETALPGITTCTGGPFTLTVDPYLRSIAPNGDIYLASAAVGGPSAILVNKSTDGGLTWTMPITIDQGQFFDDKPSTTADPADPLTAYVVFERDSNNGTDSTFFSRTTDGGRTWEAAREISVPGKKNLNTGHNILVLPGGTLVCFFTHRQYDSHSGAYTTSLATLQSADSGQTWLPISGPTLGPQIRSIEPTNPGIGATDPDNGLLVHEVDAAVAFAAVDPNSGALYAVWEDGRFSGGQYVSIAFAQSMDGGLTWSEPIAINRTPDNIPPADRQAFRPSIAVAADGTIGVTYYDFRFNDSDPGTRTDYWFVSMRPRTQRAATDPSNWRNEVRLTDASFDLQAAAIDYGGEFIGDSNGLATVGNDFVATWSMPAGTDQGNIYFRRLVAAH